MKKTMKHTAILRGFPAALAAFLTLAGCSNPVSPPPPASGPVGRVTFTIGGAARAVLPSVDQFAKITLSFTGKDNSDNLPDKDFTGNTVTVDIETIGSWDVSVKAYIGAMDEDPAAVSSAAKTVSWDGPGNAVTVTEGNQFLLVPAEEGKAGKLRYTVTLPVDDFTLGTGSRIRIEQNGVVLDSLDDQNFTDGERAITASIETADLSLAAGLYVADILVAKNDDTVAVYRKSVSIMSGLITAIVFEAEDFLDPATAAARVDLEALEFGLTEDSDAISDIDYSSPPALFITGTAEATTVFFTLTKTADQNVSVGGTDAASVILVTDGEEAGGSTASETLAVFAVQNVDQGIKEFTITVTEQGRSPSVVNVTVLQEVEGSLKFGLYTKAVGAAESAYAKADIAVDTLDDILQYLAMAGNLTKDTSYLAVFDGNQEIAPWASAVDASKTGVEITLRGINMETKNGGANWEVKKASDGAAGSLFVVNGGTTLVFEDGVTINGNGAVTQSMVYVTTVATSVADASFVMRGSSKITGATVTAYSVAPAVTAIVANSSKMAYFTMEGGEITGNTGVDVIVQNSSGSMTMDGGKITGNTTTRLTNVLSTAAVTTGGTFLMRSGEISGNSWRGVSASIGTFTMEGGKITGNGTTAAYNNGSTVGIVGAGLYLSSNGVATITGGEISGNGKADSTIGRAIYHSAASLSLSGEVAIEGSIGLLGDKVIFLDNSFVNVYDGGDNYAIPIVLRSGSEQGFVTNWADGKDVLKNADEALIKTVADNFVLGGGVYSLSDSALTPITINFSINQEGYYGMLKNLE